MAKGDDIQERLIDFSVAVINLCGTLPDTQAGRHLAGQLLRCGTSPAPNYGEARGAESKNDFLHKLRIVLKELNESQVWLDVAARGTLVSKNQLAPIRQECVELSKIINASIQTSKSHKP
ncbi:MAG: four helix bundle protein [Ignavibacteriae bacterium]|nr:four helix bundle protein [Ignavibacteriota bacterium]